MTAAIDEMLDDLMCQGEVAHYLTAKHQPIDQADLSRMANRGAGPPFRRKWGRNLYAQDDVDQWIANQKEDTADTETTEQ